MQTSCPVSILLNYCLDCRYDNECSCFEDTDLGLLITKENEKKLVDKYMEHMTETAVRTAICLSYLNLYYKNHLWNHTKIKCSNYIVLNTVEQYRHDLLQVMEDIATHITPKQTFSTSVLYPPPHSNCCVML